MRTQEAQKGFGWAAGKRNIMLYSDNVSIAGQDQKWVQDALTVTIKVFRKMGLKTNFANTKSMVCTPVFIWGNWGEQAYKQRAM